MAIGMREELNTMLIKKQVTFGTEETSLTNSDFAEVEPGAIITYEPSVKEMKYVGVAAGFAAPVVGPIECGVKFTIPLRTGAAEGSTGLLGRILKGFGMAVATTDTDTDSTQDRFIYTISEDRSNWEDFTGWFYTGAEGSNQSLLTKVGNVMFKGKINLNFDDATAMLEVEGRGAGSSSPATATRPTCTSTNVLVPALKNVTFTLLGDSDYRPISMEIDFNQEVIVTVDPTKSSGRGVSIIKRNGITWKAKVYKDVIATVDPYTALSGRAPAAFSCAWGTAPNKITLSSTKALLTAKPDDSDQNGISTWDLSGVFVDNDFAIQLDTAAA